jgi:hypothetical protein
MNNETNSEGSEQELEVASSRASSSRTNSNSRNSFLQAASHKKHVRISDPMSPDTTTTESNDGDDEDHDDDALSHSMDDLNVDDIEQDAADSGNMHSFSKTSASFSPVSIIKRTSSAFSTSSHNGISQEVILEEVDVSESTSSFLSTTTVTQINENKWQEVHTYKGLIRFYFLKGPF